MENKEPKKLLPLESLQEIGQSRVAMSTEASIPKSKEKSKGKGEKEESTELAELLLYKSCRQVFKRIRDKKKKAYDDVKCSWDKPQTMKKDLMKDTEFWDAWKKQSNIYEMNSRERNSRPTIDRIESNTSKGGHYIPGNIRMLSYLENAHNAKVKECMAFFINDNMVEKFVRFSSNKEALTILDLPNEYLCNVVRNSGQMFDIGNEYTLLIRTVSRKLKNEDKLIHNAIYSKKTYIEEFKTGKVDLIATERLSFQFPGIWLEAKSGETN